MRRRRRNPAGSDWILWGGGAALLGLALWKRETIANAARETVAAVADVVRRGRKLTDAPAGPDGVVPVAPERLRAEAAAALGIDLDQETYSLARMIRSEGAAAGKVRALVCLNDAAEHGWSAHTAITYSTNPTAKGWYGEQYTPAGRAPGGVASKRRYASTRDPYESDVATATEAQIDHRMGLDITGGAVKFVDVSSMGVQEGSGSYAELVERWSKERLRPFTLPGYSTDLVVFRRV